MSHFLPILAAGFALAVLAAPASGKLPPPSDEAKAKAAEAAAKAAHNGKVDAYKLCKSMDAVAAGYHAQAKKEGRAVSPPVETPACADPGAFVYAAPAAPGAAAPAAVPAAPAAPPAQAAATAPKK
ncbi:MAG: hypothetical protein MUF16_08040 [Burkholderiaceae bacterium]|nr:hypothetical protein [Burkholderiaceae bacterium]